MVMIIKIQVPTGTHDSDGPFKTVLLDVLAYFDYAIKN